MSNEAYSRDNSDYTKRLRARIAVLEAEVAELKVIQKEGVMMSIEQDHFLDENGNPAGGTTVGKGIWIDWQNGPLAVSGERLEPNGAFVEDVIRAAIGRLEYYNSSKFRCRENSLAITKLEEALHWLNHRTADREQRGVEGTHEI